MTVTFKEIVKEEKEKMILLMELEALNDKNE